MEDKAVALNATRLPPKLQVVPVFRSFAGQKLLLFLFCALLGVKGDEAEPHNAAEVAVGSCFYRQEPFQGP